MKNFYKAVKITDRVWWVGAIDWRIRDFHGYATKRGTTYNAYLIMADKITLIDTVKAPFKNELLSRISSVINPKDIKYIISNHAEMDHSGCLPEIIEAVKPEKVFASVLGTKALADHFHMDTEIVSLKDGEKLSLGNMELTFVETKMIHWPDSMFAYLAEESLLFSQDGFGMHLATGERFADLISEDILEWEAAKYYANILLPFSSLIIKLLEKVTKLGIPIKMIAPDHGPIWRREEDINKIISLYNKWAAQKPTAKVVITYDTMWDSTAKMADAIAEGVIDSGIQVKVMPLRANHRSDVVTEILDAGALVVGSPTMNSNMFPTVADFLTYVRGLKPVNLIGSSFGSYGWSGEAVGQVKEVLGAMKVELAGDGLKVKYVPAAADLAQCYELGKNIAAKLKEV